MSVKRFVVTGGAGFIGSAVVERLTGSRHRVVVVDSLASNSSRRSVDERAVAANATYVWADIRDAATLQRTFEDADVVIHAAAENHVAKSISMGAESFVATNVEGTVAVLEAACAARRLERLVLVSSSEVYGTAVRKPMTEAHPLMPRSPYAATKAAADRIAAAYVASYGLPVVIVRPFNTYGPRQRPEAAVARFVIQALEGCPLTLEGDGTVTRDWVHVRDTAAGILAASTAPLESVSGRCINLATGVETSVIDLARVVTGTVGVRTVEVVSRPDRPGQVRNQVGCSATAARLLAWVPSIPLADGIEQTAAWYRHHPRWWRGIRSPQWWERWLAGEMEEPCLTLLGAG